MQYWLLKSEPDELSIDALALMPAQTVEWFGVRNYQARNFMRDKMQIGDLAFFWHSSCPSPGIYGIAKIVSKAHADSYQFNPSCKYYDPAATPQKPRWWCVDVQFVEKVQYLSITQLRQYPELAHLQVLSRGNRLSITPIQPLEWQFIYNLCNVSIDQ